MIEYIYFIIVFILIGLIVSILDIRINFVFAKDLYKSKLGSIFLLLVIILYPLIPFLYIIVFIDKTIKKVIKYIASW